MNALAAAEARLVAAGVLKPVGVCSVGGCDNKKVARGWCGKHYQRWAKYGDPAHPTQIRGDDESRFWSMVDKGGPGDCWLWSGGKTTNGYGQFFTGGVTVGAHRYAYELMVGPIPEGMQVDHRCHNEDQSCGRGTECLHRRCVRAFDHLRLASPRENVLAGRTVPAANAMKSECKRGHLFDEENTYWIPSGGRECRACKKWRAARRRLTRVRS